MEDDRNRAFPANEIRVCIDSFEEDIGGRLYNKMQKEPIAFHGFSEMLLRADALFDRCGYPQAFQEKRDFTEHKRDTAAHFAAPRECLDNEEMEKQHGRLATVDILIRSRRQTSWQGFLIPFGGKRRVEFRSEMELLECISNELNKKTS